MGTFDSSRYKNLSDEKAHAILVRGEALVFKTAISVISSGTDIFAIANACLSIRESYKIMEQCEKIGKVKKWESDLLKKEFDNGTKFGMGVYMLYLSVLPSKVLTLLEWIGFKGDRDQGLKLLYEASNSDTARSIMCNWFAMAYHFIFQFQFGAVGEAEGIDIEMTDRHLAKLIKLFPNGVLIRFNQGKSAQIRGQLDNAIEYFAPVELGWTNFSHFCYWDLYWCHGMNGNFQMAAQFAEKLINESAWSPAIYTWMQAVALLAIDNNTGTGWCEFSVFNLVTVYHPINKDAHKKGKELLTKVESLRQKIGGKSIPDEKFAARKAANYVKGVSTMPFGFMEAAYWFNYLKIGNDNQKHAEYWLDYLKVHF